MTEDEMVGWHHWLDGHGFGWTPGVGDGQEGLVCCGSWGHKESDTTEQLNWTETLHGFKIQYTKESTFRRLLPSLFPPVSYRATLSVAIYQRYGFWLHFKKSEWTSENSSFFPLAPHFGFFLSVSSHPSLTVSWHIPFSFMQLPSPPLWMCCHVFSQSAITGRLLPLKLAL